MKKIEKRFQGGKRCWFGKVENKKEKIATREKWAGDHQLRHGYFGKDQKLEETNEGKKA